MLNWSAVTRSEQGEPAIVDRYVIYRGIDPYVTPTSESRYGTSVATTFTDSLALSDPQSHYYFVTAVNVVGRESAISNRVGKSTFTIVPGTP